MAEELNTPINTHLDNFNQKLIDYDQKIKNLLFKSGEHSFILHKLRTNQVGYENIVHRIEQLVS